MYTNNPIIGLKFAWRHDETKLDASFPEAQFHIEGYQYPSFRQGRDKNGGGKMIFIREGLIVKRLYAYEDSTSETKCLKRMSKEKWCVTFAYKPPYNSNKDGFPKELNKFISKNATKYENVLVVVDLDMDILNQKKIRKITYLTYVILSRSQVLYRELHA